MATNKIYLGNLSKSLTPAQAETQPKERFSRYGDINEVLLPVDGVSGVIKGYSFISFAEEASAQSALAEDGQTMFGDAVTVQIATEKNRGKKKS